MTAERAVALAYLVMAVLNLAWQGASLRRLVKGSTADSRVTPFYSGLLRTARCRVGVAMLYLGVGLNALYPRVEVVLITLGVHGLTMAVWMAASWADVRLGWRLKTALHEGVNTDLPTPSRRHCRRLLAARHRKPPAWGSSPGERGAT